MDSQLKMSQNNPELTTFERLRRVLRFYRYAEPAYTVRNLARYCRVTEQTIFNWLKGKTRPTQAKIKLIEEWLDSRPTPTGLK